MSDATGSSVLNEQYDGHGHLLSVENGAATDGAYGYDAFSRLVQRVVSNVSPSGTTQYLYDEFGHVLGDTSHDLAATEDFWSEALAGSGRRIAWMSRRVAGEYAGFLEWLSRLGESPCEVVDLSEIVAVGAPEGEIGERLKLPPSLSLLTPELVLKNALLDRAEILQWSTLRQYLALWRQLRLEDAPLRVLVGSRLQSAPITYFDGYLLSNATKEWQRVSRLVGMTMAQWFKHSIYQTDELVFFARARALVDSGTLRISGTVSDIRQADVRLPKD